MSMDISDFYQTFFDEADELLDDMEQHLLGLNIDDPDNEELNAIFRAAHSIKGGAGTFGFTILQDTTHRLENLLDSARHDELTLDKATVDVFLETRDMLKDQLNAYREEREPDPEAYERICKTLQAIAEQAAGGAAAGEPEPPEAPEPVAAAQSPAGDAVADGDKLTITVRDIGEKDADALTEELSLFGDLDGRTFEEGVLRVDLQTSVPEDDIESVLCFIIEAEQLTISRQAAAMAEQPGDAAPDEPRHDKAADQANDPAAAAPDKPVKAATAAPRKQASAGKKSSGTLRVPTDKIDQIINLVGELVITQSMLDQTTANLDAEIYGKLSEGMSQLQRNARDLQEAVMSVRMMPMDYAFSRFPRMVRDLSAQLGKQINLETQGASTELDKGMIEQIMDPMTHLVRNSLDHGIETPEKREAMGKPAAGTLILAAQHQGGNILIEISDDGAGMERDVILAKARESGIPVSDGMSDDEVWQLIFAPGFSTAAEITDVSGRGVGMDVVKRNIQKLGGHVDVRSETGKGTTITIALPLTLAIMDGMSVQVGDEVYIIPLGAIMESMQAREDQIKQVAGNDRVLHVRGEYLSLVELHQAFDVPNAETDLEQGIVVVLQAEGRRFALLVDQLLGQHQVVVKNLEANYRKVPGVSAATILGDGSVALILDVVSLSRSSREERRNVPRAVAAEQEKQLQEVQS